MNAPAEIRVPMVNATRFRAAHEEDWERLDKIVTAIEKRGVRGVPEQALLVLPLLYRSTLSSLSVARETSLDKSLVAYLEQLCTRAYFQIYGVPTSPMRQLGHFFARSWPRAVQSLWKETLVAFVLTAAGALVAYLLISSNPSWFYILMPDNMAQGRDPTASVELLRSTIYDPHTANADQSTLAFFASFLFTHNAQIAILSFAPGLWHFAQASSSNRKRPCSSAPDFAKAAGRSFARWPRYWWLSGSLMKPGPSQKSSTRAGSAAGSTRPGRTAPSGSGASCSTGRRPNGS